MWFFEREFRHLDPAFLQELEQLENEGAVYSQLWVEELEDFRFCRINFRPREIVEYVTTTAAYDEFLGLVEAGFELDEALSRISDKRIRERVRSYNTWAEENRQDTQFCPAAFHGPDLESLLCGGREERYEFFSRSYEKDRRFLLMEILEAFPQSTRSVTARSTGTQPYKLESEFDVRDLLFVIIKSLFPDARMEERTRQHAGNAKQVDIVVPKIDTLIEVKFVRNAAHSKLLADELRIDFESYHVHAHCGRLIAYVWDPHRLVGDRTNFIQDLRGLRLKDDNRFHVDVLVKP